MISEDEYLALASFGGFLIPGIVSKYSHVKGDPEFEFEPDSRVCDTVYLHTEANKVVFCIAIFNLYQDVEITLTYSVNGE